MILCTCPVYRGPLVEFIVEIGGEVDAVALEEGSCAN